jgi:hypothetical protein
MRRTIIYIVVGIVVVAVASGVAFWFFSQSRSAVPAPAGSTGTLPNTGPLPGTNGSGTGTGNTGSLPTGGNVGTGTGTATKFGVTSNEPVINYFVDSQNNLTVVEPSGKIARITNGEATFLSSAEIVSVISAGFSYDGTKVLVNFGDPANPQTSIFDVATKAWAPLAAGVLSPAWSPSDYRIAYLKTNTDGSESLTTLDVSKTTSKPILLLSLNIQDLAISWPNKNQIVFHDKPSGYIKSSLWSYDLQKKILSQSVAASYGLETLWSNATNSVGLVFSGAGNGTGGSLSLMSPAQNTSQKLAFVTLPSKCTFNYETMPAAATSTAPASTTVSTSTKNVAPTTYLALYCALPQDQGSLTSGPLPDGYDQMAFFTADTFYKVHTDTGAQETVFAPPMAVDATNLKLFTGTLFFVNRYDQKLYAISLAQ